MRTRLIYVLAVSLLTLATAPRAQQQDGLEAATIRAAIERALTSIPRGVPALQSPGQTGVRAQVDVQSLSVTADRITIDLNQNALAYAGADGMEGLTAHLIESTAALTGTGRHVDYRFLVGGVPLDQLLSRAAPRARTQQVGVPRRIVISAGHGWYRHEPSASWRLQRDYYWGIVEDFVNWEITHYLQNELIASSFDVRTARAPDRNGGAGTSGHPRWEESAKYHIQGLGAPGSTWDFGVDDYAKDINSRPFYADWVDAALLVSIHNNGGGGTGTETWYDSANGHEGDSRRLAEIINARIVSTIRDRYDPGWPDRGLRSCNGCKGENRLTARPAVIVEVAFMDTRSPDNDALHSEAFELFVAQAIRDGIQEFVGTGSSGAGGFDVQVRTELTARAARDPRFGAVVEGSYGVDAGWDPGWELRWLEFVVHGSRRVRLYHTTSRTDRGTRYIGFWDPDTGSWRPWERVQ